MSIKVIDEDDSQSVTEFIQLLKDISPSLDILAHIQAYIGGLSLEFKSGKTLKNKMLLDAYIKQIEINHSRD